MPTIEELDRQMEQFIEDETRRLEGEQYHEDDETIGDEEDNQVLSQPDDDEEEDIFSDEEDNDDEDDDVEDAEEPEIEEDLTEKGQTKEEFTFAKMRKENKELADQLKEERALKDKFATIAKQLGYADVDAFLEAYQEAQIKKEAEQKGVDPEFYKKQVELERKVETMEKKEVERKQAIAFQMFDTALNSLKAKYNLTEAEVGTVLNQMGEDGYTIDDLSAIKNPERVLKGYMSDIIAERKYQKKLKAEKKERRLDTIQEDTVETDTVDDTSRDAIRKELEKYAKDNNLTWDD